MRILVISNFYPPHFIGGYELGCRDVVDELRRRGHDVRVLTSTYGVDGPQAEDGVYRWLDTDVGFRTRSGIRFLLRVFAKERTNQKAFHRLLGLFQPELIYIWNPVFVSLSLALEAQQRGYAVHYFVSDGWMARAPAEDRWLSLWSERLQRGSSRFLRPFLSLVARSLHLPVDHQQLQFEQVQFVSRFLREGARNVGKNISEARVIHWGIDPELFPYRANGIDTPHRLLYVGQVVPEKGTLTAIEAVKVLRDEHEYHALTLDIVGGSVHPEYVAELKAFVRRAGLDDAVRFRGAVPRHDLPSIYQAHDVLVFPSVWEEPFSITLLEGLSSGLPVVGTLTGGSREILEAEVNALIFQPGDASDCALQISRLLSDRQLYDRIRRNGRITVQQSFAFSAMIDQIEAELQSTVKPSPALVEM